MDFVSVFCYKNIYVQALYVSLIGNPVKIGDGPAAVTPPFVLLKKGTLLAFVYHCPDKAGWEGR
jgi:hypothetical protein